MITDNFYEGWENDTLYSSHMGRQNGENAFTL